MSKLTKPTLIAPINKDVQEIQFVDFGQFQCAIPKGVNLLFFDCRFPSQNFFIRTFESQFNKKKPFQSYTICSPHSSERDRTGLLLILDKRDACFSSTSKFHPKNQFSCFECHPKFFWQSQASRFHQFCFHKM